MCISTSNECSDRINCKIHILPANLLSSLFYLFIFFKVAVPQAKVCVAQQAKAENGLCRTCGVTALLYAVSGHWKPSRAFADPPDYEICAYPSRKITLLWDLCGPLPPERSFAINSWQPFAESRKSQHESATSNKLRVARNQGLMHALSLIR